MNNMTNQSVKILYLSSAISFDEIQDVNHDVRNLLLERFQSLSNCEKENYIEKIQIIQEFAVKQSIRLGHNMYMFFVLCQQFVLALTYDATSFRTGT